MRTFKSCDIEQKGAAAVITLKPFADFMNEPGAYRHWDLASAMTDIREDDTIRVVVIQGSGGSFLVPSAGGVNKNAQERAAVVEAYGAWRTFTGVIRFHQTMAEMEKPVVAKVNGDAVGFGLSIVLACDLIIAREDAVLCDHHLGMGEVPGVDRDYGIVPGDGGVSLFPLIMSPYKAKEYLLLAKTATAREFADMGIINAAVPAADLDRRVEETVQALLRRSAFALAWTKRIANRHIVEQLNRTLDAGAAYEMVNFLQLQSWGGVDRRYIAPPEES